MVIQRQANGTIAVGFTSDVMETKQQIETFAMLCATIPTSDVEALIAQYNHLDTIGPIFDPTAYMHVLNTKGQHTALAAAFLSFRREIDKLMPAPEKTGEGL